jgi:hypothetical protein
VIRKIPALANTGLGRGTLRSLLRLGRVTHPSRSSIPLCASNSDK